MTLAELALTLAGVLAVHALAFVAWLVTAHPAYCAGRGPLADRFE